MLLTPIEYAKRREPHSQSDAALRILGLHEGGGGKNKGYLYLLIKITLSDMHVFLVYILNRGGAK